jgi:hypothetical protein
MTNRSSSISDSAIIAEVRLMYNSPLMLQIRDAHQSAKSMTLRIGRYNVQYEPYAFSGMTAFPDGFVVGKEAFSSEDELKKTFLHEVYRLCHSSIGQGADADRHSVRSETDAAFQFAERSYYHV